LNVPFTAVAALFVGLIALPGSSSAVPTAAQTAAICQHRAGCTIGKSLDGGKPLAVVQASVAGCTEDWLIEGSSPPRALLKRCKDGGTVTAGPNRLTHKQTGTSDVSWERSVTYSLSPWKALNERGCSYRKDAGANGTATDIDYASLLVRSVDRDTAAPGMAGCPIWPTTFTVMPAVGQRAGYDVAAPILDKEAVGTKVAIGDCVPAMTTAGANGFITRGAAASADRAAEIKVVSESTSTLLVQVFDPVADSGSRVEVWFPAGGDITRIGVTLSGPASVPSEKKDVLPSVERWQATDAAARNVTVMRLSWANQSTLFSGMAIAYSQNESGKPSRVVANTGIANDRPAYLPKIVSFADAMITPAVGVCHLRDGRLMRGD
jgi:hypothetical protein